MRTHGGGGITIESISMSGSFAVCQGHFPDRKKHGLVVTCAHDIFLTNSQIYYRNLRSQEGCVRGNAGRHKNIIRELGLHVLSLQSSKLQRI